MFDRDSKAEKIEELKSTKPYLTKEEVQLLIDLLVKAHQQINFINECDDYFSVQPEYVKTICYDQVLTVLELDNREFNDDIPVELLISNYDEIIKWVENKKEENRKADEEYRKKYLNEKKEERRQKYLELKNEFENE